jgi:hypothetical protein
MEHKPASMPKCHFIALKGFLLLRAVQKTPQRTNEHPIRAVPRAAQQHREPQIIVCARPAGPAAAKGDIQIVREPPGQTRCQQVFCTRVCLLLPSCSHLDENGCAEN